MTYLSYVFLLGASLFSLQLMRNKERGTKTNLSNIFEGCYWGKNLEIHKHSWLLMVWIFKKLKSFKSNYLINYFQSKTSFWAKLTKNHIQQLKLPLPWTNLCFILIIALSLLRFELSRVNCSAAPISFHQLAN